MPCQAGGTACEHGVLRLRLDFALWREVQSSLRMTECGLVFPVDLGLLQLVGIIHVDRLPLGIEIDRADAAFAMAVAGCFGAAEGTMHFGADGRGVDVGDARVEVANR